MGNQAELARRFVMSRARVTQIMGILKLPAPVVDYLSSICHDEKCRYSERQLRQILRLPTEKEQVEAFEELKQAVDVRAGSRSPGPRDRRQDGRDRPNAVGDPT